MSSYAYKTYPYRRPVELDGRSERRKVVIVGAGIAGPTLALSLAARGVPSIVLDDDDKVSFGSRSICQSKHSLEIWDRFGIARRMVEKGITWEQGEVYLRDRPIWRFNLQPEPGHKFPAFVNLQQYYVEEYLYDRCAEEATIDMRHRHKVIGVVPRSDGVTPALLALLAFGECQRHCPGRSRPCFSVAMPWSPMRRLPVEDGGHRCRRHARINTHVLSFSPPNAVTRSASICASSPVISAKSSSNCSFSS